MSVLIETTIGDLVFDLYTKERPRSCLNFLKLCKMKYYNFCLFHSVRRNFIAQSGDPTGSGRGGESIYAFMYGDQAKYFDLELKPRIKHRTKGTISFVNNGNNMHGSQFFITLGDGLDFLDGKHTVFGQLAEGFDILEKLNETICDETHKPYQDVRISHTVILDDPFDDPTGLKIPDRSPEPTKEQLDSGRIAADEDIDEKGKSKEEVQKKLEDKELEIGTKILETVGDIDDADLKPPENILFVCKLNPVTNADDLKIIFSRFGKILSCEIITDHKSGDSLGYGFVEFKEVESCEKAYFKMDNVLIDDRRIHVDFCQSVAKLKWHKSSAYKKAAAEKNANRQDLKLKDKSKKERENAEYVAFHRKRCYLKTLTSKFRYSMVFDDADDADKDGVRRDNKKKQQREEKMKKQIKNDNIKKNKYSSESESEDERERKIIEKKKEKRKSLPSKELRRRSRSSSYSSDEDDDMSLKPKTKKNDVKGASQLKKRKDESFENRGQTKPNKRYDNDDYKKRNKPLDSESDHDRRKSLKSRRKQDDSDNSSDQNTRRKSDIKSRKSIEKTAPVKKPPVKKSKKYDSSSDSESDYDNRRKSSSKQKPVSKKQSKYSDSESESDEDYKVKRKSMSSSAKKKPLEKPRDKSRERYSSSEREDYETKKSKNRKPVDKKNKRKHDEDEDDDDSDTTTEEYTEELENACDGCIFSKAAGCCFTINTLHRECKSFEPKKNAKKRPKERHSSDDSSEDDRKYRKRRKPSVSSPDERRKSSTKKTTSSSAKKTSRRRNDYSDYSD